MSMLSHPRDRRGQNESASAGIEMPEKMKRIQLLSSLASRGSSGGGRSSIDDLLLRERIIFLSEAIHQQVAHQIIQLLLYLQNEDDTKDISLYINSPGGSASAGLAIYDTIQFIKPDVSTICVGKAMSMASILLAAGAKGKRYSLRNSTILIHQPLIAGVLEGQVSALDIEAKEIIRVRKVSNELLARHTGQPLERVEMDTDRDYYLTAEQALAYGLIDEILPT